MPRTAPLPRIMAWLAEDMNRISAGLWREDWALIADAAERVAFHPKVSEEERRRIFGILGEDAGGFRRADLFVHETAKGLREAARAEAMDRVLTLYADLQRGCVACHDAYRDRLRAAPADTTASE